MADTSISTSTVSDMNSRVTDFEVDQKTTDGVGAQKETTWTFDKWPQYFGYYKQIPELKASIDAIAKWTVGKGFQSDDETTVILDNVFGYGEDTFNTILKNMIIVRQINGDAFAEIIRNNETGQLLNLKPLDPSSIKIVANEKGLIERYEQINKTKKITTFRPQQILHLTKGRVADEIHGTSIIEAVEGIILKRNEALEDYQKVLHRNVYPFKVWHLDTDDQTEINAFITKVENTVRDKENIFIPKGNVEIEIPSVAQNATLNPMPFVEYLSSFFFQAVGIPQIILGGSQEFTEATAKIAYLAFQQSVEDEQRDIEAQLWAQLALRIKLEFPASLENELLSDTAKDGAENIQPNETTAGRGA